MTGIVANFLLNALIVVLLAVTIGYCWLLNRRIRILQDSRGELALLLKHFDASTQRASESIIALQTASKKIGENIQFRIEKANYLIDDLTFMIEKGNKLANQMEAGLAVDRARKRVKVEPQQVYTPKSQNAEPEDSQEESIESLLDAARQTIPDLPDRLVSSSEKTAASLEAVLDRVGARVKNPESEQRQPSRERTQAMRNRSKAEQELLDMIKAGIKG